MDDLAASHQATGGRGSRRTSRAAPLTSPRPTGSVIGYANWAPWRPKDGYRHTVEDSVYLTEAHQGHGLGADLLRTLIASASDCGAHVMMACIESSNSRSVALHQRLGFELVGTAREVGTKFGRWLDLTMLRLAL